MTYADIIWKLVEMLLDKENKTNNQGSQAED